MIRKLIEKTPVLVSIILLTAIFWSAIFLIESAIGYFIPIQFVGPLAGLSGVAIGVYVRKIKS